MYVFMNSRCACFNVYKYISALCACMFVGMYKQCIFVMERAGAENRHLFQVAKDKNY